MSILKPLNRKELYKAAMAGEGEAPSPLNRKEQYASEIAGNINQGGGSSGGAVTYHFHGVPQDETLITITWDSDVTTAQLISDAEANKLVRCEIAIEGIASVPVLTEMVKSYNTSGDTPVLDFIGFCGVGALNGIPVYFEVSQGDSEGEKTFHHAIVPLAPLD